MIYTEKKNNDVFNTADGLIKYLRQNYKETFIGNIQCFINPKGNLFKVSIISDNESIVIEYANSEEEASKNLFEDGDQFYPSDYQDMTVMYREISNEINDGT